MSIDSYFCFCCLATKDLNSIVFDDTGVKYVEMLNNLFSIKLNEQYNEDCYICLSCSECLNNFNKFKAMVFNTLHMLQHMRLIQFKNINGEYLIDKFQTLEAEELSDNKEWNHDEDAQIPTDSIIETIKKEDSEIKVIYDEKAPEDKHNNLLYRDINVTTENKRKGREVQEYGYEVTDDLKCKVCCTILQNTYAYHIHMNQHFPNYVCEACGKGFINKKRLKRHMTSHERRLYKCKDCASEFLNLNSLNGHKQRKHGTLKLYKCSRCEARFDTITQRTSHLNTQHSISSGDYTCRICMKVFLVAGNLRTHIKRMHLNVKRYFCFECKAGFYDKDDMVAHTATHTGVFIYQCEICTKRFPRKRSLDVHLLIHKGERQFCCDVCGKRFVQKCALLSHCKTHNRKPKENANNKFVKKYKEFYFLAL